MVTASHNPARYNGYKVYGSNACQIIPPADAGIAAAIEAHLELWPLPPLPAILAYQHDCVQDPLQQVADAYYAALAAACSFRSADANARAPRLAYTALHGVGTPWLLRAFRQFGLPPPVLAKAQCSPDPDFSTGEAGRGGVGWGGWGEIWGTLLNPHARSSPLPPKTHLPPHPSNPCASLVPQPRGGRGGLDAGLPGSRGGGVAPGVCK